MAEPAGARFEERGSEARMARRASARPLAAALALMVASGFAALGCQIVWTQQSALWLGHETPAVLAVVAAFFGGLSLGALGLGGRIERSRRPARWYAACEATIGLWSLACAFLLAPAGRALLSLTGEQPSPAWQWTVAFGGTLALLLPATAAMGATLPAMERVFARLRGQGVAIAALYAGNSFGALLGVLGAAFWLVPALGLMRTALVCALLNLACAALTCFWLEARPSRSAANGGDDADGDDGADNPNGAGLPDGAETTAAAAAAAQGTRASTRAAGTAEVVGVSTAARLRWLLAATGLLGIGYEVLVVRVLSQVAENTVYTFALLLAVYLVGTAAGAAALARLAARRGTAGAPTGDQLLWMLALACLAGTAGLWAAPGAKALAIEVAGPGMTAALGAEALVALIAFLPATLVMGALFSRLITQALAAGLGFGHALGINTLGAAAAPLLFGVWLAPAIGAKFALLLLAAGYLALLSPRAWRAPGAAVALGAGAALAVWAPPLTFIDIPAGGRLLSHLEGPMGAVSVVEDGEGVARLHINNRQQEGSSATRLADARQALLPLLLHPAPQRALFLGLGTGITAAAAAADPALQVDAVELLPEVIEASSHFREMLKSEGDDLSRLRLLPADARRFVRASAQRYDLIVSDNFHPARSGSGALYSVEHFRAVSERLAADGLFCQWLPLHQLDLATLRSIVRSFQAVFPQGWALLATNSLETPVLGLVARSDGRRFDLGRLRERHARAAGPLKLAAFGLHDELAVFGAFVAGPRSLARLAGEAPINTDDHPVVSYRAPQVTYAPDSLPRDRLLALLEEVELQPAELLDANTGAVPGSVADAVWPARLAAYLAARNRFLQVGRAVRPTTDARRMLEQVREPLLEVLRTSPDFRPAYDPLLRMAQALARQDPPAARALLLELRHLQPQRSEAEIALRALGETPR